MKQWLDQSRAAFSRFLHGLPVFFGGRKAQQDDPDQSNGDNPATAQPRVMEYESIESGRRAQAAFYQTVWLEELVRRMTTDQKVSDTQFLQRLAEPLDDEELEEETGRLISMLHATLRGFGLEFNTLTADVTGFESLRVSTTELRALKEQ
ncbi:MAG: hypothetical protein ACRD3W_08120, partial [Terriglobales bacterium]